MAEESIFEQPQEYAAEHLHQEQHINAPEAEPEFAVEPETVAEEFAANPEDPATEDGQQPAVEDGPTAFPPHVYFPMHFGKATGGSVAVANSFSTGSGASYSHAISHGVQRS